MKDKIEIPFGAQDSELCGFEYTIPEGMEAEIKDGKVIVRKKESEDERIRKNLIRMVGNVRNDSTEKGYYDIPFDKYIAYLEKQKETISREAVDEIRREVYQSGYDDGYEHGKKDSEQKEQKPSTTEELNSIAFLEQMGYTCIHRESRLHNSHNGPDFEKAVNDLRIVACLFANWKDESSRKTNNGKLIVDVDTVETIINANHVIQESDVFDWEQAYQKGLNHGEIAGYNKAMKEQKPAWWSDEDEKIVADFLYGINVGFTQKAAKDRAKDILSLLRPQPHWKPSEEQMKGIKYFLDYHRLQRNACIQNWPEYDRLQSLYDSLKKL